MKLKGFLFLLPVLPLLSGCVDVSESDRHPTTGPCLTVTPSPARAGDEYSYLAEGVFWSGTEAEIVDWRFANPDSTRKQEVLTFSRGSRMEVRIGEKTENRMGLLGEDRPAYQATFWAFEPGQPSPLAFLDQWVDAETGAFVQRTSRTPQIVDHPSGPLRLHGMALDMRGQAPLLLAPAFWGHRLSSNDSGAWQFPQGGGFPYEDAELEQGKITYRVAEMGRRSVPGLGDVCVARVVLEVETLLLPEFLETTRVVVELAQGFPLPVSYHAARRYEATPEDKPGAQFWLQLSGYRRGSGASLPAFDGAAAGVVRDSSMERRPPEEGFPADGDSVFPTSFRDALAAARQDQTIRSWLENHADATLVEVVHRMGAPGSGVVDQWTLWWGSPADSGIRADSGIYATVERLVPLLPPLEGSFSVASEQRPGEFTSLDEVGWMTLDQMADVHQGLHGEAPEVLRCYLQEDYCQLGTHENTGEGHAGSSFAGFAFPGVRFWLSRGWVMGDGSASLVAMGPPVE